jgi:hypothetical protein
MHQSSERKRCAPGLAPILELLFMLLLDLWKQSLSSGDFHSILGEAVAEVRSYGRRLVFVNILAQAVLWLRRCDAS